MRILTPNAKYALESSDELTGKNAIDSQNVVREAWVENVYQIHDGDFSEKGVFIDIGANIGAVSLQVAAFNDNRAPENQIKVYAFEPEPNNLKLLNKNVKSNGKADQIRLIDKAVYNGNPMFITNEGGNSTLKALDPGVAFVENIDGTKVETISLDDVFTQNNIAECDVLKMDIEGSEYAALLTCDISTLRKIKYLTLEFSAASLHDFGQLVARLATVFGIQIIGVPERGGYIYAKRY